MRISVVSLNLWNTEFLDKRLPAMEEFLKTYDADIFLFQEIRPVLIEAFERFLPDHEHIVDEDLGWHQESNIFYRKDCFKLLDHGKINLEMPEKYRGLFWAKFEDKRDGKVFFASTCHFTWQGHRDEVATGISDRKAECELLCDTFPSIFRDTPVFLTGDFNDPYHPTRILKEAGFDDVFDLLHEPHPVTFPCLGLTPEPYLVEAIDKIMVIGMRPLMATSPHFYIPGLTLSDHYPVAAMLEI